MRRALSVLAIAAGAYALSGCSASFSTGGKEVKQSDEVVAAKKFVDQKLSSLPATKSVDCDGGVDFKAGSKFNCRVTLANGQEMTIPFAVTSTTSDTAHITNDLDVVDNAAAVDLIYKNANTPVKSVTCPVGLAYKNGKTFTCKATFANGDSNVVTIQVGPGTSMKIATVKKA